MISKQWSIKKKKQFERRKRKKPDYITIGRLPITHKLVGVSDSLLKAYIEPFKRFQKALIYGQISEWSPVKAGVPQGSIYCPLFF